MANRLTENGQNLIEETAAGSSLPPAISSLGEALFGVDGLQMWHLVL